VDEKGVSGLKKIGTLIDCDVLAERKLKGSGVFFTSWAQRCVGSSVYEV
jgi:hypothetical protein